MLIDLTCTLQFGKCETEHSFVNFNVHSSLFSILGAACPHCSLSKFVLPDRNFQNHNHTVHSFIALGLPNIHKQKVSEFDLCLCCVDMLTLLASNQMTPCSHVGTYI